MKKLFCLLAFTLPAIATFACEVCERNQPKLLRGIIHGTGADSNWDYLIVAVMMIISLLTLYYAVKWLVKPGERNDNHIKYSILNNEGHDQ
ncbi:MAG TPA: hypothetical protein VIK74_02020 [Parasegetibacter sp.]